VKTSAARRTEQRCADYHYAISVGSESQKVGEACGHLQDRCQGMLTAQLFLVTVANFHFFIVCISLFSALRFFIHCNFAIYSKME